MADTIRSLSDLQSMLADNLSGEISAQDIRDVLVSLWASTIPDWSDVAHLNGQLVRRSNGDIYRANSVIPAASGFTIGTSGTTWSRVVKGSGTMENVPENRLLKVDSTGLPVPSSFEEMPDRIRCTKYVEVPNNGGMHVNASQTISHGGLTYFVDTIDGPITLTVADGVSFFTIHDSGLNFALNNCTVDFGGGLTSVLDSRGEMAVFYNDAGDVWHVRGFGAGVGTRVGGYPLPIVNGGAEQGLNGWTQTRGSWEVLYNSGRSHVFAARFSTWADLQQDIAVPPSAVPELGRGSGSATLRITWFQYALFGEDQGNVTLEFFDANMVSLGTNPGPGLVATPAGVWTERTIGDVQLPINTHTIRITLVARHIDTGFGNYAYFDDVSGVVEV